MCEISYRRSSDRLTDPLNQRPNLSSWHEHDALENPNNSRSITRGITPVAVAHAWVRVDRVAYGRG
jgi:hypothetical protein